MKAAFLEFLEPFQFAGGCSSGKLPPYPAILTAYITGGKESLCPLENLFQSIGNSNATFALLSIHFNCMTETQIILHVHTQSSCSHFQERLKYRVNSQSPASKPTPKSKYHIYSLFYLLFTTIYSDISFVF